MNPNDHWLLSDHLAPLSAEFEIPYYLENVDHQEMVKKYYPGVNLFDKEMIAPQMLLSNFDTILTPILLGKPKHKNEKFLEKIIFIYCHHGFSRKDPLLINDGAVDEPIHDIVLAYGKHMLDLFDDYQYTKFTQNSVMTGNYRYQYYLKYRSFFDELVEREVFSQFKVKQPVILYAPTWNDSEKATSFFDAIDTMIDNTPSHYNVLIKLHPNLALLNLGHVIHAQHRCQNKGNIVLLDNYPLVYPILNRSDIFVGDVSSIGYDYLTFNRPMFFIHANKEKTLDDKYFYLYRCGKVIHTHETPQLFRIIDGNLDKHNIFFKKIQREVYNYTFCEDIPFEEIYTNILNACKRTRSDV